MTDTDKLKRLAGWFYIRATPDNPWEGQYIEASQAILALIAERDEAVALLREAADAAFSLGEVAGDESADDIARKSFAFIARVDANTKG